MKSTLAYFITVLFMLSIFIPKKAVSQDNDGLWGALAVGAVAAAIAIEDNKEYLEALASNEIFSNYSEYQQFRVKVIGWGDGGKRLSDKGKANIYPFAFTELHNNSETNNRKLLILFASPGWVNEYGLDYTKVRWEFWSVEDWNRLLSIYSEFNSPVNMTIESGLIPIFRKEGNKGITTSQFNNREKNEGDIYVNDSKDLYYQYIQDENKSSVSISNLKFTKQGWEKGRKLVYPFYSIKGDDYIIKDYSETLKIFSNENALGIFLKKEEDQMLLTYKLVNKIHSFINNHSDK